MEKERGVFSDAWLLQDVYRAVSKCDLCDAERPKWFRTVRKEERLLLCDACNWADVTEPASM